MKRETWNMEMTGVSLTARNKPLEETKAKKAKHKLWGLKYWDV